MIDFCQTRRVTVAWLALVAITQQAVGQQHEPSRVVQSWDAGGVGQYVLQRRPGFSLFASSDHATIQFPARGDLDFQTSNLEPCDEPLSGFCHYFVRPRRDPSTFTFQFFDILVAAGAPPSQWRKIQAVAPSAANATGGGWTALINQTLFAGRAEWGPADGQLGRLFAPPPSIGPARLAVSTDTTTWPPGGFLGDRPIPAAVWQDLFRRQGAAFRFDYWRVPGSLKAPSPLGDALATYGEISDHYAEILADYGAVIPGGTGAPTLEGYPLGLVWRFDAFTFADPSLENVVFWRATVINRSADVYGAGVDYDSLYLGFDFGMAGATDGGGQRQSAYFRPDLSAVVMHQSRVRIPGPCDEVQRQANVCAPVGPGDGYGDGATAFVVLKSPIGDLRNKLFTRRADGTPCAAEQDAFCDRSHPARGDTITFNHGHLCGYLPCWSTTYDVNDRRAFGMVSSTEANVLDGRDPGTLSEGEAWITFRNAGFPAERGVFNRYAPGAQGPPAATWDWNHDGIPDTLSYTTCARDGCVAQDWDTLPGGLVNAYGNMGNVVAAGPFSLTAGDSTSWFVAFVGARDSVPLWDAVTSATRAYLDFFPRAEPAPAPAVVAVQASATSAFGQPAAPTVRLTVGGAADGWVDPYLLHLSERAASAVAGDPLGDLGRLNPWLADSLAGRARDNVEAIEIYKSCDGGRTFTADADCVGDPSVSPDGTGLGLGWRAYAVLRLPRTSGAAFVDSAVVAGRQYTYVVTTKTRGAAYSVVGATGTRFLTFAPSVRTPLSPSLGFDPPTTRVYVPITREAGYRSAQVTFTQRGVATVPFSIDVGDSVVAGSYSAIFGNRIIVERDSLIAEGTVTGTQVIVERVVHAAPGHTLTVVRADTVFRANADVLPVTGQATDRSETTLGNVRRASVTYGNLGFALTSGTMPLFVSTTLTGLSATPMSFLDPAAFTGFTVTADETPNGAFGGERAFWGAASRAALGLSDTALVVPRSTVDPSMVQWREQESEPLGPRPPGRYVVEWQGDAFGLTLANRTITIDPSNPSATETALRALLTSRPVATVGLTDAETATLLDDIAGFAVTQQDLVAVRLPFTIRNTTFGRDVRVAMVRRALTQAAATADSYLLGRLGDTVRVAIPQDEWVPGDELYLLEDVTRDSTVNGDVALDATGQPVRTTNAQVTFRQAVFGCNYPSPPFCVLGGAADSADPGYLPTAPGDSLAFAYYVGFEPDDRWDFVVTPPVAGRGITEVTDSALREVRVVPNPFVVGSLYHVDPPEPTVVFTHMPPSGTLRVYSVSGQFVQQVTWEGGDLQGTGDLHVVLRARTGNYLASGLYLWVLTTPSTPHDATSATLTARGKFVVIQGAY